MFTQQYPSYPYRPSTNLNYTDAIGTSKDDYYTGLGSVFGRWNPIPIGAYADIIIRQMGATTKDIEAHLRNVIGKEVSKTQPFIFIPNANAPGKSGGYFYDKQTGQIHTEEQMGQKSPIYVQLAKGEITEDEAKEQISGVKDIGGNVWNPTGDNTVDDKTGGSDQDGDNNQQDEDEDGTTTAPTTSGTTNKFPGVSSNTAVFSGGNIWVRNRDTKIWEIWVDPTLPEWIKKAIDEDSNVDETIDILSSSTEDLDGDGIPDFLDPVDDTASDDDGATDPIENPFPDKQPPLNNTDPSNQITWLDEIPSTGQDIVKKMLEMNPDANVSKEQILSQFYFDGRPNTRAIANFYSNYSTWKTNKSQKEWNEGDADDDGVLNEFDANDFSINAFVGGSNVDTDNDGVPDSLDPFPNDPNRNSITEVGAFEIKWTTKDGRIIKIPIWGGENAKEGLNATIDADGNVKISIGINVGGAVVEHDLGSPEEIGNKINDAIDNGTAKVEEIQETTVDIFKIIFGIKDKDEEEEEETVLVDNDGDGVYSDVDYDDDDYDVQTKDQVSGGKAVLPALGGDDSQEPVGTIVSPPTSTIEDPVKSILDTTDSKKPNDKINIKDSDRTNYSSKLGTESGKKQEDTVETEETGETTTSIEGQDPYEDIIETETSIAAGLGGGGLFQGTTAEALGRFMPKEIVQPVPFARRAAVYQRPRYSLFSEYI